MFASQGESESQPLYGETMDEKLSIELRHGFIRKVFALVTIQLAVTATIAAPFVIYAPAARVFVQQNQALLFMAMFLTMGILCYSMCNPSALREYPKNYLFLSIITLCFGLIVGATCTGYTGESVLMAAAITVSITTGLTLYACQTKHDFTGMGPYLMTIMWVMMACSFVMMFFPPSRMIQVIYSGVGACLFSFYIIFDVQLIVGGKHNQHRFGIDEYCFAALNLYLDIINLFLMILRMMGERR